MDRAEVVVIGGAAIGSSVACHLVRAGYPGRVVVVEPDPGYARAATALAASGIRQQFGNPLNVAISAHGVAAIRAFPAEFGIDLGFREQGYLTLADPARAADLAAAVARQRAAGAATELLDPRALVGRFPHLSAEGIALAAFGPRDEGWFDNMGLLRGYRDRARAGGAVYLADRVTGMTVRGGRVVSVTLGGGGRIGCDWVVNAAGGAGAAIAALAGIPLPVERRKRTVFAFRAAQPPAGALPLMIDPSGVWCRPEGAGFIAGCTPDPDPAVEADDFAPRHDEWDRIVWPALAARSKAFEALKLTGIWAGHYDMNTLDQNAILGPHPQLPNLLLATGFSGHGLQQAPAVGRGLAEWICHGAWISLDLAPLGAERIEAGRPFPENAVI